jgi:hypothetical protein
MGSTQGRPGAPRQIRQNEAAAVNLRRPRNAFLGLTPAEVQERRANLHVVGIVNRQQARNQHEEQNNGEAQRGHVRWKYSFIIDCHISINLLSNHRISTDLSEKLIRAAFTRDTLRHISSMQ